MIQIGDFQVYHQVELNRKYFTHATYHIENVYCSSCRTNQMKNEIKDSPDMTIVDLENDYGRLRRIAEIEEEIDQICEFAERELTKSLTEIVPIFVEKYDIGQSMPELWATVMDKKIASNPRRRRMAKQAMTTGDFMEKVFNEFVNADLARKCVNKAQVLYLRSVQPLHNQVRELAKKITLRKMNVYMPLDYSSWSLNPYIVADTTIVKTEQLKSEDMFYSVEKRKYPYGRETVRLPDYKDCVDAQKKLLHCLEEKLSQEIENAYPGR